ncbi:leader peptidase (prepilin peptidase) / N-methyltransferase [Amycolatopsis tolypomycina]|uniref:Leader peptidase (Prepilin peptidase) / N-methyltransferase n=1 Tax=Amycolatopsis tolypomycina TaxID=208445 RepID=A0A1H5C7E0_9PSEU|nr:A24 family peptidase [Amycolatopsis tolypomycina]SED62723.1 leader peptidase (prepilin peptidase) / N-methyltransferase [Amycolatopsis tolypomycina]
MSAAKLSKIAWVDTFVHDGRTAPDGVDIIPLPLFILTGITAAVAVVIGSALVVRTPRWQVAAQLVIAAALVGALAGHAPGVAPFAISASVAAFGVPLAFADARHRRLPNPLVLGLAGSVSASVIATAVVDHDAGSLARALAGAAVTAAFFLAVYFTAPGQLGGGDVKLAIPLGAALAWFGWQTLVLGSLLPWLAAAIAVVIMRLGRRRTAIPMGPFVIAGALAAMLLANG